MTFKKVCSELRSDYRLDAESNLKAQPWGRHSYRAQLSGQIWSYIVSVTLCIQSTLSPMATRQVYSTPDLIRLDPDPFRPFRGLIGGFFFYCRLGRILFTILASAFRN